MPATSPVAANLVEIENVTFSYGGAPVLDGISLTIPRGSVVAIMGGSGSGKTTLLRLIGGALRPSKGEIRVFGRSVSRARTRELYELRRKMGMLFQFGALFTDLSAFDNVAFPMRERTQLPEPLIRDLNDALDAASIVVTHDVHESLAIVDYLYFLANGRVVAQGTPDEVRASTAPFVHQFVHAEPDGPVPFHYPAPDYAGALLAGR